MAVSSETGNRDRLTSSGVREIGGPFDRSTRGRLLAATATVIAHGGYRQATVDRILREAHVGWTDFSSEFEDLDACFVAALDAGFECAAEQTERAIADTELSFGPDAAFEASLSALLARIAASPDLANLCLVEAPALGARAVEHKERGLQRFVRLIQGGLGRGRAEVALPPLAAEMVVGGIYEVVQRKVRRGQFDELGSLPAEFRQLWMPALRSATGERQDV